jgi:hypothetical protein
VVPPTTTQAVPWAVVRSNPVAKRVFSRLLFRAVAIEVSFSTSFTVVTPKIRS